MNEPYWWWSANLGFGWASQPVAAERRALVDGVQKDLIPWADSVSVAFIVERRDDRLVACVTGLPLPAADSQRRPGRARCVVIAPLSAQREVLSSVATLVVDGVPDRMLTYVQGSLVVDSARLVPRSFTARGPIPLGHQQRVQGIEAGAGWLPFLDTAESTRFHGSMLALGSPLLTDAPGAGKEATIELAEHFRLVCGPKILYEEVVPLPKAVSAGEGRRLPLWLLVAAGILLFAAAIAFVVFA